MPKVIFLKREYGNDTIVGVCNNSDCQLVIDELECDLATQNINSMQMKSFTTESNNIQKSIDELTSEKLRLDMTEINYQDRPFFSKMKNLANQEIERRLNQKRNNLEEVQEKIEKLKKPVSNYYAVDVKLLKPKQENV